MIAFKSTRMAGYTAIGTGLATLGVLYLMRDKMNLAGYTTYDRDMLGLVQREQLNGAPVQVLTGGSQLGLPVAEELSGLPVAEDQMGGTPPVEVLTGATGFGTAFGTNFYRS